MGILDFNCNSRNTSPRPTHSTIPPETNPHDIIRLRRAANKGGQAREHGVAYLRGRGLRATDYFVQARRIVSSVARVLGISNSVRGKKYDVTRSKTERRFVESESLRNSERYADLVQRAK